MATKVCKTCGIEKDLELFVKAKGCKDGRRRDCGKCHSQKQMARDRKNRPKTAAYHASYYESNKAIWTETRMRNRVAINAAKRERYQTDPEVREYYIKCAKEWTLKNPQKRKAQRLRQYGLTPEQFDQAMERAGHKCEICGHSDMSDKKQFPLVDHCHSTGEFRGILCGWCNKAIGLMRDNPEVAANAAAYLQERCKLNQQTA